MKSTKQPKSRHPGIVAAREKLGSYRAITDLVGLSRQAIDMWPNGIPPKYVGTISEATGIPRNVLRSDIFTPEKEEAVA